jgi:hypothetical protein
MPRQLVDPRSPFAPTSPDAAGGAPPPHSRAAQGWRRVARVLVAPFAAVLAAMAGLVYVLLLPICGIASIANAAALASWSLLRESLGGARRRTAPRR